MPWENLLIISGDTKTPFGQKRRLKYIFAVRTGQKCYNKTRENHRLRYGLNISHLLRYVPCINNIICYFLGPNVPFCTHIRGQYTNFSKTSPKMLWKGRQSVCHVGTNISHLPKHTTCNRNTIWPYPGTNFLFWAYIWGQNTKFQ